MKWFNVELLRSDAEKLQKLLYNIEASFEISAAGPFYHFEILLDPEGSKIRKIEKFLYMGAIEEA